jgi:hypothetical protein
VFGFAQSIESMATPITTFLIGPIAQWVFIPFMTTGAGVAFIGDWFGTGADRGMGLIFILAGHTRHDCDDASRGAHGRIDYLTSNTTLECLTANGGPAGRAFFHRNITYLITLATAFTRPGVITGGITISAVGFLTKLAIFFAAASFISSVMAVTLRSRAPRKIPGKPVNYSLD